MTGKKKSNGDRLGKLVERARPAAAERAAKRKKPAEQFGRRPSSAPASESRKLSAEERMLRAILNRD
jgi:hypothetical protein